MSSIDSSTSHWQAIAQAQLIEIGLVRVEISYPARLAAGYSAEDLSHVKEFVMNSFDAVSEVRGGKLHSRVGDGGAFMFLIRDNDSFDNCALAAIQMLEMVPALNQDIQSSTELDEPITVRIACDSGMVRYQPTSSADAEEFVRKLMKLRIDAENRVTISERIYRQLSKQLKSRFVSGSHSAELGMDLFVTTPAEGVARPAAGAPPAPRETAVAQKRAAAPVAGATMPAERRSAPERSRGLIGRLVYVPVVGAILLLLAGILVVRAVLTPSLSPPGEEVQSEPWRAWRQHVHEKLALAPVTEQSLAAALEFKPPAVRTPPAAALRHDQAMADVLLSYPGVRDVLRKRLGINERFLGTGFSSPMNVSDYGAASVHEYLIPNLPDDSPHVLTLIFHPFTTLDMDKKVKEMIEEHPEQDETTQKLKQSIRALVEAKKPGSVLIRFALFDKKHYRKTLGPPERRRTFASDLTEVWNLKVKEAADRSGYTFTTGDTFFVWVLVPRHAEEAVPATWGHILQHLPKWLEESAANE